MNRKGHKALRAGSASLLLAALALILLPAQAYADGADVTDEATLVQAVTEGKSPIRLAAGIETGTSLSIPAGTVVDLNGCIWTVTSGTVAIAGTVEANGGELLSANGGAVRVLTALALENVSGTETIQSVTYADGVTDSAASYIAGNTVTEGGTAALYLVAASGIRARAVQRVTTNAGTYRIGSSTGRLSREYSIQYNLDGGTLAQGANPAVYTASDPPITLQNPTKEGYIFLGWSGTGLSAPSLRVTIAEGSRGERSYTANWRENPAQQQGGGRGGSTAGGGAGLTGRGSDAAEDSAAETPAPTGTPAPGSAAQQSGGRRIGRASSATRVTFDEGGAPDFVEQAMGTQTEKEPPPLWPCALLAAGLVAATGIGLRYLRKRRSGA